MKLRRDEERVVVELDHLDEALVGRRAAHDQPGGLQTLAQEEVDLVAMAVALVDDGLAVELTRAGAGVDLHRVGAEAHRPAEVGDLLLLRQEIDDRMRRLRIELRRVGALQADDVAAELHHRDLHAQTYAQERDPPLARDARGTDLALDPAPAEAAGDEDPVGSSEPLEGGSVAVERLRV